MKELGIYVHIPFCKSKCAYCDFLSYQGKEKKVDEYIKQLKNEIEDVAKEKLQDCQVDTIYIGGGTPSYIDEKHIVEILEKLNKVLNIKEDAEITIEVNPGTVDLKKLEKYYNSGINRLSIGLQSTDNRMLKNIGRIHTYQKFEETYTLARQAGFKNINVDLMIGLPNEKIKDVENDLERIIQKNPEHISVYSLILEEDTKLEEMVRNNEVKLPNEKLERKMYWKVKNKLEEAGYIHYEISNFAKQGYNSKHNMNCWKQKEYIGFGVGAHSYFEGIRYSNTDNFEEYLKEYKKIIHEVQNKEMQMKEFMLLGLRKIEGIKISEFKEKFVSNPIYEYRDILNKLVNQNLIEVDIDSIYLSKKGMDLANLVWEEFI